MCRGEFNLFNLSQKFKDLSPWRLFKENRGLLSRRNFWLGRIAIAWTHRHKPLPSSSYLSFLMLLPLCVRGQFNLLSSRKHYYEKDSGGDGIPAELFQILKDDAVKMLHSIWQQIWKTQQWPQDWKRSVFTPIPKKGNAKECSHYPTIALISHASKIMLKILRARLQQYVNQELPDIQTGLQKGRGTRDQLVDIH